MGRHMGALATKRRVSVKMLSCFFGNGIRGETPVSTVETEAAPIYSGSGKFSPLFNEGQFVFTEPRKATESQS